MCEHFFLAIEKKILVSRLENLFVLTNHFFSFHETSFNNSCCKKNSVL